MDVLSYRPLRRALLPLLTVIGLLALAACGSDSNPTAPAGGTSPVEEIRTPRQAVLRVITLDAFDEEKSSGASWDAALTVAPRRPDVYVTVQTGNSSSAPIFVSKVRDDAFSGAFYDMSTSSAGTGLPKTVSASRKLTVSLYDEDGVSADDFMGSVAFDPVQFYRDDNAAGFTWTVRGSGGTKFRLHGTWVY